MQRQPEAEPVKIISRNRIYMSMAMDFNIYRNSDHLSLKCRINPPRMLFGYFLSVDQMKLKTV